MRKRLSPEESKRIALEAARDQLIEDGPQSVTLKAVAGRIGRTHANLLHHFGSAAGLQLALAAFIGESISDVLKQTAWARQQGRATPRDLVDLAFDCFDQGGAGALASWIMLNGNEETINPIVLELRDMIRELVPDEVGIPSSTKATQALAHTIVVMAVGDALLGRHLSEELDVPREAPRRAAETLLTELVKKRDAERLAGMLGQAAD